MQMQLLCLCCWSSLEGFQQIHSPCFLSMNNKTSSITDCSVCWKPLWEKSFLPTSHFRVKHLQDLKGVNTGVNISVFCGRIFQLIQFQARIPSLVQIFCFCKAPSFWIFPLEQIRGNPLFRKSDQINVSECFFLLFIAVFDTSVVQCSSLWSFSPLLFLTSARYNNFNTQHIGVAQVLFSIMLTFSVFSILIMWWSFPCWKVGEGFKHKNAGDRQSKQQNRPQQSCCYNLQTTGHVQTFAVFFYQLAKGNRNSGIGCCG